MIEFKNTSTELGNLITYVGTISFHCLYTRIFDKICRQEGCETDSKKLHKWIIKNYTDQLEILSLSKGYGTYCLKDSELLIVLDSKYISIFYNIYSKEVEKIIKYAKKLTKKVNNVISFVVPIDKGYGLSIREFNKLEEDSINYNYNIDECLNKNILEELNKKKSGLYLFYGAPGTGKSSYIRYLKQNSKDKKFIFISTDIAANIDSPQIIKLLMDNSNAILVIEDAERLLVSRERNQNSVVSGILNMTSGLLGECLNIQIICTVNTNINTLDEALLRKGRLIHAHEFTKLSKEKSQKLVDKLGFDYIVREPMNLADIYNLKQTPEISVKRPTKIGFNLVK